jgi:pimeloyl-ACP methyl ester carboxylesterase
MGRAAPVLGRVGWSERTVTLPRLAMHLRELPSPGPALVLLHGLGVDGGIWQAVGRRLSPAFSLVAADLRGHGESEHPVSGYHARDYAADIAELLEHLAGEYGTLFLLGHSLGALAALGGAALNPDAVQRLVLEDPPLNGPGPLAPYLTAVLATKRQSQDTLLQTIQRFQPELGELVIGMQARMWRRTADAALEAILAAPATVFDVDGWLEHVTAPTLLMVADPTMDARLQPQEAAAALLKLREGRLVEFPGSGHVIHGQRVAVFCRVVSDFLLPMPAETDSQGRAR